MKASQETDCAHRAETPCGDLRPFTEKTGGEHRCFSRMRPGSFFVREIPRVREARDAVLLRKGGGSGELH